MQQIRIAEQNKKTPDLERFSIWNKSMVRELDTFWNHFVPSMYVIYEKLVRLGIVMLAGEIVYLSQEEVRNVWL